MLQYVPQFREKTFVVAVDGAAVADENFVNILMDVAVLWSLSIRTVLVHGDSDQIKALAEQLVEKETIDTDELRAIVEANSPSAVLAPGTAEAASRRPVDDRASSGEAKSAEGL